MSDSRRNDNWRPRANPWLIAVSVTLAAFMEILDTTIVNVSLPHIAGSLSSSYDDATWTLTSYLVANGIVLPISGSFARVLGRKRYFLICIVAFTICSFLCGIASSLPELIVFRLLQGFFGGGLQPSQQSIILDTFPPAQRGRAFSVVAVAVIFAPIIGPTLGGWITDTYSWRWIFLVNVPVGIFAFIVNSAIVEDPPWPNRERMRLFDLDWVGVGFIALGFGCLEVMLDRGEDEDWFGSPFIVTMAILTVVGITLAVCWLLWTRKPVVDLRVFADRNFAVGSIMVLAMFSTLYSSAVIVPQLAQQQLGYTATLAGLILSPGGLIILPLIPLVSKLLLPNVQTRYIIGFGFFSLGCALLYATNITPTLSFWDLAVIRMTQTFGLAFLFVPNSTITYATLPRELNTDGSSLYVMLRNISGSIGISLATAIVREQTQVHRAYLVDHLTPFDQSYNNLVAQMEASLRARDFPMDVHQTALGLINRTLTQQASYLAYIDLFSIAAVVAFCMVPVVFLFRGTKPAAAAAAAPAH
ncbi:MAG TPA: DHA2 family efflux MFS transporter permease subunit [Acetobacteraceae bacterium]|nr:DHA2 family efflux MFS transporter permease subunit [Acetobacteraceae bacterium]